jgi:hypothetical protein
MYKKSPRKPKEMSKILQQAYLSVVRRNDLEKELLLFHDNSQFTQLKLQAGAGFESTIQP